MPAPYISIAEARDWLKITGTAEDAALEGLILVATQQLIDHMEQDILLQQTTETLTGLGGPRIFPRRNPLVSVSTATIEGRAITVEREDGYTILATREAFPRGARVTVTYQAGYATLPETVKLATKMQVAALYTAPLFDQNLNGEQLGDALSGSLAPQGAGGIPRSVIALLNPYKRKVPFH